MGVNVQAYITCVIVGNADDDGVGVNVQAYITCVIGVHFVGFLMLTLSLTTGVTAYISGHLRQYTGRIPLILTGQLIHCFSTSSMIS